MKKLSLKLLVALMVVAHTPLSAQTPSLENQWDQAIVEYQKMDWLNADLSITQDSETRYRKQIGFADIELKRPFKDDTLFPIASLTKQFTATAILMLHDDKRLSLNQPIIKVLKSSHPIWQRKVPNWAYEITIHQLLTHTSGLPDYLDESISGLESLKDIDVLPYIVTKIKKKPLLSQPGDEFHYSNTGYLLLYAIIETVSGHKDVNKFFNQRLFHRLKMSQTFMPTPAEEVRMLKRLSQNRFYPSRYVGDLTNLKTIPKKIEKVRHPLPYSGGAGMISTLEDLSIWNNALYQGKVLSARSFKLLTTPHVEGNDPQFGGDFKYGYGIFIIDDNPDNIIFTHGGWLEGIRTQMSYGQGTHRSVIMLSNLSPDENQSEIEIKEQVHAFTKLSHDFQFASDGTEESS